MTTQQVLIFGLFALIYAVEARSVEGPTMLVNVGYNDIPQRCIDHNNTRVSCADVESDDALLPHPDDCELFYYCVSAVSEPICRQCPASLHFNPQKHVCDLPADAGCVASTSDPETESTVFETYPTPTWSPDLVSVQNTLQIRRQTTPQSVN